MNELLERLRLGAEQLVFILPPVLAALVLLLAGYFLARQVRRWVDATLHRLDFKAMADAGGITEAVERTGKHVDPGTAVARLAFWLVMLVVILLASAALGLESINDMFGAMIAFLPTLVAAVVIVVLSVILGEFVRVVLLASAGAVAGVPTLAKLAKATVVLIGVFMALTQIGLAPEIVTTAFTLILGAVALATGLAFGLGNRELAGEITRRWYLEGQRRDRRATDKLQPPVPPVPPRPPAARAASAGIRVQVAGTAAAVSRTTAAMAHRVVSAAKVAAAAMAVVAAVVRRSRSSA